ncbi:MAG TPA: STM3941 family protein [Xanthobacteraceae bacterium]|nr:STM3941 family protein [Xanthobacteraceae bacterium]
MQVTADASRTIEIKGSPTKLLLLITCAVLLIAACVFVALQPNVALEAKIASYVGIPFFGLCLVMGLQRLMASSGTVITISPEGIRDTRVASKLIPWGDVTEICSWEHKGQKIVILAIPRNVQDTLDLTRSVRWTRSANRMLIGHDALWITSMGLQIDYKTLIDTCWNYWQAYRATGMPSGAHAAK